jgi:hypothetical protein
MSYTEYIYQILCGFAFVLILVSMPALSWSHGYAGKRFFPSTLSVDDPFISDEFSLLFGYLKDEEDEQNYQLSVDISKRIAPHFGLELGDSYEFVKTNGEKTQHGFSNLGVGLKYQFLTNAPHEAIMSVGLDAELGHTGDSSVGADNFTTLASGFFFGKGFGDLPETLKFLRPFAVTGVIGPAFTIDSDEPDMLEYGFTVQYSFQYLEAFVKDVGLPVPFNRMILVVEFPFETDLNEGGGGKTQGFVNPGIIWFGKYIQLGLEAQIPVNSNSGDGVGVLALFHVFIDDVFPNSLGRPIFR